MGMFDGRRDYRRGAQLAVQIKWMASLINAPTVVFSSPDKVRRFPKVLPVVPGPNLSCLAIHRQPPWIAQTVGPNLRPCIGPTDKWIVRWHGVIHLSPSIGFFFPMV